MSVQYMLDLKAYRLDSAKKLLVDAGVSFCIAETVPVLPMKKKSNEPELSPHALRVLRERITRDGILELVVAKEVVSFNK